MFAVVLAVIYFAANAFKDEFVGTPAAPGQEESARPGLRDKAKNAGAKDRKKKEDRLNDIGED